MIWNSISLMTVIDLLIAPSLAIEKVGEALISIKSAI
jgi:hypothetical protein